MRGSCFFSATAGLFIVEEEFVLGGTEFIHEEFVGVGGAPVEEF